MSEWSSFMQVSVSVMITTRNRQDDLRKTLDRLLLMNPLADEIVVTADGCSDETVAMMKTEFSDCRLLVNETGRGSICSRDQMLRVASGDIVVSLDDDSHPLLDDFFGKLPALFAAHPEAAVFTFPELRGDETFVLDSKSAHTSGHYVSAYPNGAAAMRRADYLEAPGFPEFFIHAYEEPDYALQCYGRGKTVWFEPSLIIRHYFSTTNRNNLRTHHLNARNELWSVWMRCPWPWLPLVSLFRLSRQFAYSFQEGWSWVIREPIWWLEALSGAKVCFQHRIPISWRTYLAWMRLARKPIYSLQDLKTVFGLTNGES